MGAYDNESTPSRQLVPMAGPGGPSDTNFLLWREVDRLDRRIDSTERRIGHLDEHGSRGVDSLKAQIEQIRKDFADHENMHVEAAKQAVASRRWILGLIVALVTPLYPLIWAALSR